MQDDGIVQCSDRLSKHRCIFRHLGDAALIGALVCICMQATSPLAGAADADAQDEVRVLYMRVPGWLNACLSFEQSGWQLVFKTSGRLSQTDLLVHVHGPCFP